jgi:hypothetical protein
VGVLADEVGEVADEDLVLVSLDYLAEHGLIESGYEEREASVSRLSRRRFIRRVGVVGTAAAALPLVQSLVAPVPAAASPVVDGIVSDASSFSDRRLKRNIRTLRGTS